MSGQFNGAVVGVVTVLAPHQERMLLERAELDARIAKLQAFTMSAEFDKLDEESRLLMLEQFAAMQNYSNVPMRFDRLASVDLLRARLIPQGDAIVQSTGMAIAIGAALTLMGAFASIYHPVGIPMLVQKAKNPGFTIGVNGLAGNMGIAIAAGVSVYIAQRFGWQMAFVIPGVICLVSAVAFVLLVPREDQVDALADVLGDRHLGVLVEALERLVLLLGDVDRRRDLPARHAAQHT